MTLAIIAAGEGSRMRAEGIVVPKPLITVSGTPLIERIITSGLHAGVGRICCIMNAQSPELLEYFTRSSFGGIKVEVMVRSTPSSMHSLFALAPMLQGESFLLATADTVFRSEEFDAFVQFARNRSGVDGVLAVTQFIDDERPLSVELKNMRVTRFSDVQGELRWATGGVYYFSPRIFDEIEEARRRKIERLRNFLRLLLEQRYTLEAFFFTKMIDVDHVHDISAAEVFLREANLSSVH